ncbi:class I SAM-dependent methyltransferase [Calothrix sp. 336/3]|uniref:class I SAM-dependent methyltransferase n=1 Tax=Calothrix sp. 336/3 TaxID=1337936 RepID=UPI000624C413|nr:class I SAM-dependent methyltransferase [Calothrix sp. 336/3]AKG21374.1 hypothetical protein IJ00_08780 [Calothrix sp. 336/3]
MNERRDRVPFDPYYFEKQAAQGKTFSLDETFSHIYQQNLWNGGDSPSGAGAHRSQTQLIETELPELLKKLQVNVFLDIPCGDFSWMQSIDLPVLSYIGADIVTEIITENQKRYEHKNQQFFKLNLVSESLPSADLLFCRDCFVHFSFVDIFSAFDNIQRSQITYLMTTTFPDCQSNEDIITGDWRLLNLEKPPFNFPHPLYLINEQCSEGDGLYRDKSLGLWKVKDIPRKSCINDIGECV